MKLKKDNFVAFGVEKKEATDAIPTVIARYGYALGYSRFRKQVVAVASD